MNEAKERAQSIVHMLENPQAAEDVAGRAARKTAETAKVTRDITTKAANQVCSFLRRLAIRTHQTHAAQPCTTLRISLEML